MEDKIEIPGVGWVRVRQGRNIRVLSLRVAVGRGVWVNVPYGVTSRQVGDFLLSQKDWILEHVEAVRTVEKERVLGVNSEVKTKFHTLKIRSTDAGRSFHEIDGEEIRLYIPEGVEEEQVAPFTANFLSAVYRMEGHRYLPGRVKELAERHGFFYANLSFRNNRSNWGSCSSSNNISLNVQLMKLPDEVIDYVILHELCHTVEKNHSNRFWARMYSVCPNYAALREELKNYSTRL